ncbi:lipopolysaccharide biosynthesis protein [soil metagenome]
MLKATLKFLIKDSAFYGVGNAVSKSLQLITLPLVVKSVTDADFSNWNIMQASVSIIAGLVLFGMDSAAPRFYYDAGTHGEKKQIFTNAIFVQLLLSAVLLPLFIFGVHRLENASGTSVGYTNEFLLMLLWMPASALTSFITGWFKWTFKKWHFFTLTFGLAALNLLMLVYFKLQGNLTIHHVVMISLVTQWIMVLYSLIACRNYIGFKLSKKMLQKLLLYGAPLMIVFVLGIVRISLDRFFLKHYVNDNEFAMYGFAQKLSTLVIMAITAFEFAFNPMVFSMWDKPGAKEVFSKIQSLYIIALTGANLMIMSCSVPLIIAMGKTSYIGAAGFLPLMLFANVGYGVLNFALIGVSYSKKTYWLVILIVASLAGMSVFNLLLIKQFTIYAAAASQLVANIIFIGLGYIISAKYYPVKFNFLKDIPVFFAGLLLSLPFGFFKVFNNIYWDAAIKLLICSAMFVLLIRVFFYKELMVGLSKLSRKKNVVVDAKIIERDELEFL